MGRSPLLSKNSNGVVTKIRLSFTILSGFLKRSAVSHLGNCSCSRGFKSVRENWTLILRDEHTLRVFDNMVLRKIFGLRRDG